MVQYIVMAMPERQEFVDEIKEQIPELIVVNDKIRSHIDTYTRALKRANNKATVFLEDDIKLTSNFKMKIEKVISEKPNEFIQFFSMRKADIEIGSRWDNHFLMNQCYYVPDGFLADYIVYLEQWLKDNPDDPTGSDLAMQMYLKKIKRKYWIHVPSLVEHRVAKSLINPRRSSKRQSKTFEE